MKKKHWTFCKNCGTAYETDDLKVQFCSKKCLESWIRFENNINFNISRNFGDRNSKKYHEWKDKVKENANNKCQICGTKDRRLDCHHVIKWQDSVEYRYDPDNGVLICDEGHTAVHGYPVNTNSKILKDKKRIKKIRKKYIEISGVRYHGEKHA